MTRPARSIEQAPARPAPSVAVRSKSVLDHTGIFVSGASPRGVNAVPATKSTRAAPAVLVSRQPARHPEHAAAQIHIDDCGAGNLPIGRGRAGQVWMKGPGFPFTRHGPDWNCGARSPPILPSRAGIECSPSQIIVTGGFSQRPRVGASCARPRGAEELGRLSLAPIPVDADGTFPATLFARIRSRAVRARNRARRPCIRILAANSLHRARPEPASRIGLPSPDARIGRLVQLNGVDELSGGQLFVRRAHRAAGPAKMADALPKRAHRSRWWC